MSDTIDAAVQPPTQLDQDAATETPVVADLHVPARDYVRLAQGFYFVFWGLLLTVLTGAQLLMPIEMPPFAEAFLGVGGIGHVDWVVAVVSGAKPGKILAPANTPGVRAGNVDGLLLRVLLLVAARADERIPAWQRAGLCGHRHRLCDRFQSCGRRVGRSPGTERHGV